jgi:predicted dehydrogenase
VLVIGAGDLGARHAAHWHQAGARVVTVCDPWAARAQEVAGSVGAQHASAPEAFLDRDDVHVVSVCTPTFLHERYTVAALLAGKHVLCEKPVALTLAAAERMRATAQERGLQLRIGLMRRFDPAQRQLILQHSKLGAPTLAQASMTAGIRPKRLMHDADGNGGPVIDMACHLFDLWSTLFGGQPISVSARGGTFAKGSEELREIERLALDSAAVTLTYPHGNVGQLLISWGLPSGVPHREQHSYVGPGGLLAVEWNQSVTLHASAGSQRWSAPDSDAWRAQIAQFYAELTQGAPRRVATIDDGIQALKVSLAVLRAVEEGGSVAVADIVPHPELVTGGAPS